MEMMELNRENCNNYTQHHNICRSYMRMHRYCAVSPGDSGKDGCISLHQRTLQK